MTTGKSLPAQLTGRVIYPRSPGYTQARTDWDGLYRSYPLAVAFDKTAENVVNAITWARQNDVALRARSGRHGLEGWSNGRASGSAAMRSSAFGSTHRTGRSDLVDQARAAYPRPAQSQRSVRLGERGHFPGRRLR
jgi:hypothetical protein